tara:strand:+ start:531 stop:1517 length:987 start_codon:yes stop_codon:yes gene_type:complete
MNKIRDYQWPSSFIKHKKYVNKISQKENKKKLIIIENFFKKKLYFNNVFLFPSARACIATVLRYLKFNRSKQVYVNKWVSHCIFNTVGAYTNINNTFSNPDMIITVHKWGKIQKFKKTNDIKIIEDSVDSIIIKKDSLFVNNGDFEIFSLPKIIGSISGGIILSRDKKFKDFCVVEQKKNKPLGFYQSFQKFAEFSKIKSFNTWLYHESWNTYLDANALDDIISCLDNYDLNKKLITGRLKILKQRFKFLVNGYERLGPVVPIPLRHVSNKKLMNKYFLIKHINSNENFDSQFEKVYIIPIHFKISEKFFHKYLKILEKSVHSMLISK